MNGGIALTPGYLLNLGKIDSLATLGLLGVEDSLAYRVHEIETHLHSIERWYGDDGDNTMSTLNQTTPWTLTSGGGDVWGDPVQLAGPNDVLDADHGITVVKFDMSQLFITGANANANIYVMQLSSGPDGYGDSAWELRAEILFRSASGIGDSTPVVNQMSRVPVGDKMWGRLKSVAATKTLSFLLGVHAYPG